jgi:hypothetical protein
METLLADNFPTHSRELVRLTGFADDFIESIREKEM